MTEPEPWQIHVALAVVHPSDPAVWLPDGAGPVLRCDVDPPVWFPDVAPVLHAVQDRWGIEAIVLRCLADHEDRATRQYWVTYLLEPHPNAMPRHGQWVTVRDLACSDLS